MNKKEFIEALVREIKSIVGEEYDVKNNQVTKNNGIILEGIAILKKGEVTAPNIYIDSCYEEYRMGKPVNSIAHDVVRQNNSIDRIDVNTNDFLNYENVKDKIICRVVNYEKNMEELQNCPYILYCDMAITFRILHSKDEKGLATSLIHNRELEIWDVDKAELMKVAISNTQREFPHTIHSLTSVIRDSFGGSLPRELQEEFDKDMELIESVSNTPRLYVLSNDSGMNGATSILYDGLLKEVADKYKTNLYILPSSLHQVMLVPENDSCDVDFLKSMVIDANTTAVGEIDFLSNNIYYYDRETDNVTIV